MFLNRLTSFIRCTTNVQQLSNFLQKCSISSTSPTLSTKLTVGTPKIAGIETDLKLKKDPVDAINNKIKSEDIGRLFAVVHLCGKQFKVTAGDVILVEGYWQPKNGDKLRLEKVLVAGAQDFSLIGRPILNPGLVDVQATVIEKSLSHTRTHFKKKRRKQFMRINFQRQETTMLMINSIEITGLVDEASEFDDDNRIY